MSVGDFIKNSQVWKSDFPPSQRFPRSPQMRVVVMLTNVFLHLHPVSVRKSGIALSYTWCMGGITFYFLFLVETVTGVLLMFPIICPRWNAPTTTFSTYATSKRWEFSASCTAGAPMPWSSRSGFTCTGCS